MQSRTHPAAPHPARTVRLLVVAVLLAALTLATLGTIVDNDFIALDDGDYITHNSMVRDGLTARGVWTAFTSTRHTAIWHPLAWVSHMIDVELFGMRAGAHHAVGLAIHTANVLLLFFLLRSLTGALWRSALVAAVYAVHPLHVESVAWASERKDVLSSFFALLTSFAYLRAARGNAVGRSVAVPLLFALAILSKAMVVTLPFVFLLLDWWPLARWVPSIRGGVRGLLPPARLWLEKKLLFAFSAGSAAVTYYAQSAGATVSSSEALPFSMRLSNVVVSYARYLGKTAWPRDLSPFYRYPEQGIPVPTVAVALVLLAAVTAFAVRSARSRPYLPVGWLWFLGTLVPVVGFVQSGGQAMADRYTYFTLTGILVAAAWALADLVARVRWRSLAAALLSVALLVALARATRTQAALWKGDVTLFTHALRIDPDNWAALNVIGNALLSQGRVEEASNHYRRAVELHNNHFDAIHNLGIALGAQGRREESLQKLLEAVRIRPDYYIAHRDVGRAFLDLGRPEEALEALQTAVKLEPYDANSRAHLGTALAAAGRTDEAMQNFETAFRLEPDSAFAHLNFGLLQLAEGRADEAAAHFSRVVELNPDTVEFYLRIAAAYQATNRHAEALRYLAKLAEKAPTLPEPHRRMGEMLFGLGRVGEAIEHLRRAVDLDPSAPVALNNLGTALAQGGRLDEAVPTFRRAVTLNPASVDTRMNLAHALLDRGELEQAAAEFLEAYTLDPGDPRVAPALQRLLSSPGGEEAYATAVRLKPWPKGVPTISR